MGRDDEHHRAGSYASPPCLMHELDPAYRDLMPDDDPQQRRDVMRWRKAERQRLLDARMALSQEDRRKGGEEIASRLTEVLGDVAGKAVSFYWPFKGEPDLRGVMEEVWSRGGRALLPIVAEKNAPLIFRTWRAGEPLGRGIWNIPVPEKGDEATPDIVIAPVVGFDRSCYRLGYGGGYYDRTLASLPVQPRAIGVGYDEAAIPTIYPQSHDVPMELVVTPDGVHEPEAEA